jgi:hypothetical protein
LLIFVAIRVFGLVSAYHIDFFVMHSSHKKYNGTFWNFLELNLLPFVAILATEKVPKYFSAKYKKKLS